jgi:hypothetical protein
MSSFVREAEEMERPEILSLHWLKKQRGLLQIVPWRLVPHCTRSLGETPTTTDRTPEPKDQTHQHNYNPAPQC